MNHLPAFWQGRRVLVIGSAGALGQPLSNFLQAEGANVVGLVREQSSGAVEPRLQILGDAADRTRIATIIATHEIQTIFCMAASPNLTHTFTHAALSAVGRIKTSRPQVVVPLPYRERMPRFQTGIGNSIAAAFVRLPQLFGPRVRNVGQWPTKFFEALADGTTLPTASDNERYLSHRDAAHALANAGQTLGTLAEAPVFGLWPEVAPTVKGTDLIALANGSAALGNNDSLAEDFAATLAWYQANPKPAPSERIASRAA